MASWARAMAVVGATGLGVAVWGLAGCSAGRKPVPERPGPTAPAPVVSAPIAASAPQPAGSAPAPPAPALLRAWDPKARAALGQALACAAAGRGFAVAEAALADAGWRNSATSTPTPVLLPRGVTVFGLPVRAAAVATAGGQHTYRSYLGDATPLQVIRAAALQRSKDGLSYGRRGKLGPLSMDFDKGEITLTCSATRR